MSHLFPVWAEMGPVRRVLDAVVLPCSGGFLTGLLAVHNLPGYVVNVALAAGFSVLLGSQHPVREEALLRGVFSGVLFGAFVMAAITAAGGTDAPWWLVPPYGLTFLVMAVPALPLHALGSRWRRNRLQRPRGLHAAPVRSGA